MFHNTMPRYTKELLFSVLVPRDNCQIIVDKLPEKLHAKAIIHYLCECGTAAEKRFDIIHDKGGAYCPPCVKRNTSAKLKAREHSMPLAQIKGDSNLLYNVEQEDGVVYAANMDTELTVVIPPAILRPKICGPHTKSSKHPNSKYHSVSYWDFATLKTKSLSFPVTSDCIDARLDAEEFQQDQIAIADQYRDHEFTFTVRQLLEKPEWYSKNFRLASHVAEYEEEPVPIPPYIASAWIGDGNSDGPVITNIDQEVLDEFQKYADSIGVKFGRNSSDPDGISYRIYRKAGQKANDFLDYLRELDLLHNKHVPEIYIKNSKQVRLEFLAGIIDTDGHLSNWIADKAGQQSTDEAADKEAANQSAGKHNAGGTFEFVQKNERTFDGVRELVKSLGMSMSKAFCIKTVKYKGKKVKCPCYRGFIGGSAERLAEIPTRIPRKKFIPKKRARYDLLRFKLVPREEQESEIDEDDSIAAAVLPDDFD